MSLDEAADDPREIDPVKYQVFISSTFKDLRPHRAAAIRAVMRTGNLPTYAEDFGPRNEAQTKYILSRIADSQIFVLILGYCYGTDVQIEGKNRNYVGHEWDYAKKIGLRQFVFVMDRTLADSKRSKLDPRTDEDEIRHSAHFMDFRAELMAPSGVLPQIFKKPADIEAHLIKSLKDERGLPGYVLKSREDARIIELAISNPVVREVVQRAGKFTKVVDRFDVEPEKKEALADSFWQLHAEHFQTGRFRKVFLESGSTITIVAKRLAEALRGCSNERCARPRGKIATNNALLFLDLWLCQQVSCRPEPDSPAVISEKYGALYGPLAGRDHVPDYALPALKVYDYDSWTIVQSLSKLIRGGVRGGRGIILAAASGLQISGDVKAILPRDDGPKAQEIECRDQGVLDLLKDCRGFHVGSYENKLFKRCLYLTGLPTIVFLHDTKIDCPVEVGKCHFLFDRGEPWEKVVRRIPLSLWVGCARSTFQQAMDKLKRGMPPGGWRFRPYAQATPFPVVIGENEEYRKVMKRLCVTLPP